MGRRRKQNGVDVVAAMPWPVGVAIGLIAFFLVRYGFAAWISHQGGPMAQGVRQGIEAMLSPLAWMVLAICWIGAVASFVRRQGYAVEETGLGGTYGVIDLTLRKDGRPTLVQS